MTNVFRFEPIAQEPFEKKALQYITNTDPVALLKKCRKRGGDLKKGTRRLLWQLWVACYAGALGIRQQPDLFATLLEDDYFKHRTYKANLDDLLRLALLIGTDADTTGRTYKNACATAKRLQPLFDASIEPMAVLKRIEAAGGLKRLDVSDLVVTEAQPDEGDQDDCDGDDDGDDEEDVWSGDDDDEKNANDEDAEPNDYDEGSDEEDNDEADEEEPATSRLTERSPARPGTNERRTTASSRSAAARKGRTTAKQAEAQPKHVTELPDHIVQEVVGGMVTLEVEVTEEMLDKVLNAARSILLVKRVGSQEGWRRIVGVTVSSSD